MSKTPDTKEGTNITNNKPPTESSDTSGEVQLTTREHSAVEQNLSTPSEPEPRRGQSTRPVELPSSWRPPTPPPNEKMTVDDKKKSWIPWLKSDKKGRQNAQSIGVDNSLLLDEEITTPDSRQVTDVEHNYHRLESQQNTESRLPSQPSSKEKKLMKECDFFYTGEGEHLRERNANNNFSSQASHESLRSNTSNPRQIRRFRHEYEALNAPFEEVYESHRWNERTSSARVPPTSVFNSINGIELSALENSSMVYYRNGRLQIKLPNDHIRLITEPDLEPGILSVENQPKKTAGDNLDDKPGLDQTDKSGELSYVLTVEEDLYKRLLREISDSNAPCGMYFCLNDAHERRAGVGIAVCVLAVIFVVLIIGTACYPVN